MEPISQKILKEFKIEQFVQDYGGEDFDIETVTEEVPKPLFGGLKQPEVNIQFGDLRVLKKKDGTKVLQRIGGLDYVTQDFLWVDIPEVEEF